MAVSSSQCDLGIVCMFVAVAPIVARIVQADDQGGGEEKAPERARETVHVPDVGVAPGHECFAQVDRVSIYRCHRWGELERVRSRARALGSRGTGGHEGR